METTPVNVHPHERMAHRLSTIRGPMDFGVPHHATRTSDAHVPLEMRETLAR